jgi:hypothetical protein
VAASRDLGLDAARGLAILGMFVAHFAPSLGPGEILKFSEFVPSFLLVTLIGVGAELVKGTPFRWRASSARAIILILLGLVLMQLDTQILIILVWLGIATLLAPWLVELPSVVLAGVAVVVIVVNPVAMERGLELMAGQGMDAITRTVVDVAVGPGPYRLVTYLLPLSLGVLMARHLHSQRERTWCGLGAAAVVGVLGLLDVAESLQLVPDSGTRQEIAFSAAGAVTVACAAWVLTDRLGVAGRVVAGIGVASLTVYVAHVVGDWIYFKTGAPTDDRWAVLGVAMLGALAFAVAWRPVRARTGWRGPLEGPIDALARGRWPRP